MEGWEGGSSDDAPEELQTLRAQASGIKMRKASAARKKAHDDEIEQLRREIVAEGETPAA